MWCRFQKRGTILSVNPAADICIVLDSFREGRHFRLGLIEEHGIDKILARCNFMTDQCVSCFSQVRLRRIRQCRADERLPWGIDILSTDFKEIAVVTHIHQTSKLFFCIARRHVGHGRKAAIRESIE